MPLTARSTVAHACAPGTMPPAASPSKHRAVAVMMLAFAAVLGLHIYPILRPWLFDDDFAIVVQSYTWSRACENLWLPWNEHAMPLGRLSTAALVQLAGRPTALPPVTALQGPLAILVGMGLVYRFVRREMGHAFYGLVALILFGVSLKYNEAVMWFAASFAVLALDTLLLALLAAQRWRQTRRWYWLALSIGWSSLAPGWFAAGVLAGPLCCLYLLPRDRQSSPEGVSASWIRHAALALLPLLGTAAFLAMSLPHTAAAIQHAAHYRGQTAMQAFDPLGGLELTGRSLVDNLVFGVNAFGHTCPRALVLPLLLPLGAACCWWWVCAPRRRLLVLGMGLLLISYTLIYSFRSGWPYETLMCRWTRYNLFPFLGLVLFLCGGLPSRQGSLFRLDTTGALTSGQLKGLVLLIGMLFLMQFPMGLIGHLRVDRDPFPQGAALRRIEAVDAVCQEHRISAATALQALEPMTIPYSGDPTPQINGWELLRGSKDPVPITVEATRELLHP